MTRKTWTTDDQDAWLNALIPAFLKAKETKAGADFVIKKAKLFFQKWPVLPRPKDREDAKGDQKVAMHLAKEARTAVCLVLSTNPCILLIENL